MTPAAILDALMQGAARRPLSPSGVLGAGLNAGDAATPSRLLALAAQALLHTLPGLPATLDPVGGPQDPRPIVSGPVRRLMLRLVAGKGNPADDAAALALALALAKDDLRIHPFDRPRLDTFVRRHGEILGIEQETSEASKAGGNGYWLLGDVLDETNWTLATPARKAEFIVRARSRDPARGRELVEAQLPMEKAEVRLRLIDALGVGLSGADRPLLEGLQGDRAPTVKQAVTRLLARLPGTGAAAAQIEELLSRITVGKAGLLRKRTTLQIQLPANLKAPAAITDWLAAQFGSVTASALAASLGLTEEALVEAARDDGTLIQGLAFAASAERNWPLLSLIARNHAPSIWAEFLPPGLSAFGLVSERDRTDWIEAAMPGPIFPSVNTPWVLTSLHQAFAGPLPADKAKAVFTATLLAPTADLLTVATALTPVIALADVRAALSQIGPELGARALLLADTILAINQGTARP